jgi:hypothetical protein
MVNVETETLSINTVADEQSAQDEQPSIEILSKIFFLSFKFSQGREYLQRSIFRYIHNQNPGWVIDDEVSGKIYEHVKEPVRKYFFQTTSGANGRPRLHKLPADIIAANLPENTARTMLFDMQTAFMTGEDPGYVPALAREIMKQDIYYLSCHGGRVRSNVPAGKEFLPAYDPRFSHIVHYGFEGNPTGLEIYDRMFKDIANYLKSPRAEQNFEDRLSLELLINLYRQYHPAYDFEFAPTQ